MKFVRKEKVSRKLRSENLRVHTGTRRKSKTAKRKVTKLTLMDKLKNWLNKPII